MHSFPEHEWIMGPLTQSGTGIHALAGSSPRSFPAFDDSTRLVLLGHSFGGATIRVFAHLMQYGSARERRAAPAEELSPLFAGGLGERIHSLVALAAPHNGTSVYDMLEDPSFDPEAVKVPVWCHAATGMMSFATRPGRQDGRSRRDYADFDLRIDRADSLNRRLRIPPHAFCFSVPCSATEQDESGNYVPVRGGMEPLFVKRACQIGAYTGRTQGGIVIDESWKESDGLVNTISAKAPSHSPSKEFDPDKIEPGIWQTMPVFQGDHMSLQGGMFLKRDIRGYYKDLLTMIEGL